MVHLNENTLNRAIIYPFCIISKLDWYWNKLKNVNEMNVYSYEPIWIKHETFLCIIDLQNEQNIFLRKFTMLSQYRV